jgi:uncharacterized protein with WD repeat
LYKFDFSEGGAAFGLVHGILSSTLSIYAISYKLLVIKIMEKKKEKNMIYP